MLFRSAIEVRDQQETHGKVVGTRLQFADHAAMARAFNLHGERVEKAEDLDAAWEVLATVDAAIATASAAPHFFLLINFMCFPPIGTPPEFGDCSHIRRPTPDCHQSRGTFLSIFPVVTGFSLRSTTTTHPTVGTTIAARTL